MPQLTSKLKPIVWTIDEARDVVNSIQIPSRRFNYHVALGGGVLNAGESRKDLDLYFLPLDNDKDEPNALGLIRWLTSLWESATPIIGGDYLHTSWYAAKLRFKPERMGPIEVFISGEELQARSLYEAMQKDIDAYEDDDIPF